jgi:alanine dehydrogenase
VLLGVPREIKDNEYRVGLTPASIRELHARGHQVLVESGAGLGIGMADTVYRDAGAQIVADGQAVYARAELIVKVKEPQASELRQLRAGQVLFTFLHLAPDPVQARGLIDSGAIAIAYETVTSAAGALPILTPMSEVAGRMAVQVGAHFLERPHGGCGVLLAGVPGVAPGKVVILGAGVVGCNAAQLACGLGAQVVLLDRAVAPLRRAADLLGPRLLTLVALRETVQEQVASAHLVIGAALAPGALAPHLVSRAMLATMSKGAVLVDVAIDQGGCFETSRPTTHANPTYRVDEIVHYCVANMPGAVPRTSTFALNNVTLPFVLALADLGWQKALQNDPHLCAGLNVCAGAVTHPAVAQALRLPLTAADVAIRAASAIQGQYRDS